MTRKPTKTFEEAAAEVGEDRPLDEVLRQLVNPEKKPDKKPAPRKAGSSSD